MNRNPHSTQGNGKCASTVRLVFDLRAAVAEREDKTRQLKSELMQANIKAAKVAEKLRSMGR